MKKQRRLHIPFSVTRIMISLLIVIFAFYNLTLGAIHYGWNDIVNAIQYPQANTIATLTIIQVRLPMILIAIMAGSGLALSGLLLQSVTQNPLACPSLSGIEYATAFSVIACYLINPMISRSLLVIIALSGGWLTFLLIQIIRKKTNASAIGITLIGIGINSLYYSAIQTLLIVFPYQSQAILYDLNGSLYGVTLADIKLIILPFIALMLAAFMLSKRLDWLDMDESQAITLGFAINRYRSILLAIAIMLATLITSMVGPLLFFGLIIPHLVKPFTRGRTTAWGCAILGAFCVLFANMVTQLLFPQTPPPIGLVMLLMLTPFLLFSSQRYFLHEI